MLIVSNKGGIVQMFERFTDRARHVLQLANQEAQRCNCTYIDTEHILLGLIVEGSGVAATVLKNLNVDLGKVRLDVEDLIQSRPGLATTGKLPQTPRAKKVIEYSMEEARNMGCNYVGTEHILLGLLREQEGVAVQVLMKAGLGLESVRAAVLASLSQASQETSDEPRYPYADLYQDYLKRTAKTEATRPSACLTCGNPHLVRIIWNRINMSAEDYADMVAAKAIFCQYSKLCRRPEWVCLQCSPQWVAVHGLSMQVRERQLAKQTAVASEDYETAITHRDALASLQQQLSQIVEELLKKL